MVKLGTIRFAGKCERHPRFNAEDGPGAIRGGCPRCQALLDIYEAHQHLTALIRKAKNDALKPRIKEKETFVDTRQIALF